MLKDIIKKYKSILYDIIFYFCIIFVFGFMIKEYLGYETTINGNTLYIVILGLTTILMYVLKKEE